MPVGDVLVRDPGRDVKHDDATLAVDVVAVAETTELLLAGSIPHIELEFTKVGEETKRARGALVRTLLRNGDPGGGNILNLNTQSGNVFFFKLSSQMTLDEGGLKRNAKRKKKRKKKQRFVSTKTRELHACARLVRGKTKRPGSEQTGSTYLASSTIANKDQLEGRDALRLGCHRWKIRDVIER